MAEQIRSADLLVTTALANPEIIQALKENPEGTLKRLGERAVEALPHTLAQPDPPTNNIIWIIVVAGFVLVMVGSLLELGVDASPCWDKQG